MQKQQTQKVSQKQQPPKLVKKKSSISLTSDDFKLKYRLGRGAYGDVYLVQKISDHKHYAMKQIQKKKLQRQKKEYQALIQKQILSILKHPAVVKLKYAFQDKRILYFILEWCEGGQFLQFIKLNLDRLREDVKIFYIAQIVNILEYLHTNGITHRDIKPQNLMLSSTGHLKIIDFGTAEISNCNLISKTFKEKIQSMKKKAQESSPLYQQEELVQQQQSPRKNRRSTFVGTCHYISPQLLEQNYCPPEADLWALGCIIYQLYYFETPFKDTYEFAVFEKIKKCQLQFPKNPNITEEAIDLIKKLLKKNPDERLGSGKSQQLTFSKLKQHPFFKGLNVDNVFQLQVPQIQKMTEPQVELIVKEERQHKNEKTRTQFSKEMIKTVDTIQKQTEKKILIHGMVQKKTFVKYSFYYLIVYDDLSIERIKSEEPSKRKNLQINIKHQDKPAKLLQKNKFELKTVQKVYLFRCQENASKWVQAINNKFLSLQA